MFSLLNATSPAATKTKRPSRMIARRVSPKATMPFSTAHLDQEFQAEQEPSLAARDRQHIAEEDRPLGCGQFADQNAL